MDSRVKRVALSVWSALAIAAIGVGATAQEQAPSKLKIRNFDHLEFDTVTGTYFGIATFYTRDEKAVFEGERIRTEATTAELRLMMGGETIQGGVAIPYHATTGDRLGPGQNDIGDVRAHLKIIPLRKELFDFGAGLLLSFPGGEEDRGMSTGNVGTLPFVTGTVHIGPTDLNAHIGYNFVNHHSGFGASESILYGSTLSMPVMDLLGARLELAGQQFTSGENRNVTAIQPGFDYMIEMGTLDLMLSVAGSYTVTGGTAGSKNGFASRYGLNTISGLSRGEWGGGMAFAVLWN